MQVLFERILLLKRVPFFERTLLRFARSATKTDLPAATLCYLWDNQLPKDTLIANAGGTYYIGVSNANNKTYNAVTGGGDVAGGQNTQGAYKLTVKALPVDLDDQLTEAPLLGAVPTIPATPIIINKSIVTDIDVNLARFTVTSGQVVDFMENGNIQNAVNFPNVSMPRESSYRIAIANANVPNMVGQISSVLAAAGLNIHNMVNKSKGDMAYTLADVDSAVAAAVMQQISAIAGVLAVRYLPAS